MKSISGFAHYAACSRAVTPVVGTGPRTLRGTLSDWLQEFSIQDNRVLGSATTPHYCQDSQENDGNLELLT